MFIRSMAPLTVVVALLVGCGTTAEPTVRQPSPEFLEDLQSSTFTGSVDSPMQEAQWVCQQLDQQVPVDDILVQIEETVRSSVAFNSNRLNLISPQTGEDSAAYILHVSVNGLCPEYMPTTGTQS